MRAVSFRPAPPLVLETGPAPSVSLIVVHGLGTNGTTFQPVAETIASRLAEPVRVVLPNAPTRPISLYSGQSAAAWFDLLDTDFTAREDEPGLNAAADYLSGLIDGEIARGMAPGRIVLGGFSRGGALALLTGLRSPLRLGGIVALSGWLPLADDLARERSADARETPVFLGHGQFDRITPIGMAEAARDRLAEWSHRADLRTYPIDHEIDQTALHDLGNWLAKNLS